MFLNRILHRAEWARRATALILAQLAAKTFFRRYRRRRAWIISEKHTEARDNAYHLFRYIRQHHPEEDVHYVITRDSPDLHKVAPLGNVVYSHSWRHYLLYMTARVKVSSQMPDQCSAFPMYRRLARRVRFMRNPNQHAVHIRHGIVKHDMGDSLDYAQSKYSLVTAATERERQYLVQRHGYPPQRIGLVGLCRYDRFARATTPAKRQLLVAPTWRAGLPGASAAEFAASDLCRQLVELLNSESFQQVLARAGMTAVVYLHYAIQAHSAVLARHVRCPLVTVAERRSHDLQTLIEESAMLVTDRSSVAFDFAFQRKPLVYFQFDRHSPQAMHYKPGYFDDARDGFGPMAETAEEAVALMEEIVRDGVRMHPEYARRAQRFFTVRDGQACKRTFRAIARLARHPASHE